MSAHTPTLDPMFLDRSLLGKTVSHGGTPWRTTPRRMAITGGMLLLHQLLYQTSKLARRRDERVYGDYRDVRVRAPLFIAASPRSGTTYLHRLMCLDEQFTYFKLYHTLLPSIAIYRTVERLAAADHRLTSALKQGLSWIERKSFKGWEGIHRLGFDRPEEDEGLFLLTLMSPSLCLLTPELEELQRGLAIDDLDESSKQRLMDYYEGCIQRLLYMEGTHKRFLCKSVLLQGRIHAVLKRFPDAKFIHLVRHPYEAIPSFVSMFRIPWRWHSPGIADRSPQTRALAQLAIDNYRRMHAAEKQLGADTVLTITYKDLLAEPRQVVLKLYERLELEPTAAFTQALSQSTSEARAYHSQHHYSLEQFGLSKKDVYEPLAEIFLPTWV
ncbi:MAG: sulfotransferase [Myxococcota bacterium]